MAFDISTRLKHAWNAFTSRDPPINYKELGLYSSYRPDRARFTRGNERSLITNVYNRIAMDCASVSIQHVKLDDNGRYIKTLKTGLNNCLTLQANKDQSGRAFIQDVVMSMFDEGSVAIVPVDTSFNPKLSSYDILTMRTGRITAWYPDYVKVSVYNDHIGQRTEILLPKSIVAIIENPLYAIMNEPNSVVQRLTRKLSLLDAIDEQSGAGKLDLIIQLPYVVKSEARKQQADLRRKDIEMQLANSKYGIAYTDATEHITQLNRSLDNNLMKQIEYLTETAYSQLGITKEIMEGTANEQAMVNYNTRIIEPVISAIVDGMKRTFLTKTARSQNQSIMFFKDPFKLVPVAQVADIADKFTRNEIMSSNEVRQIVGMKPVEDAKADELRNKNINSTEGQQFASTGEQAKQGISDSETKAKALVDNIINSGK